MNPDEILNYALTGAKWLGVGGGAYIAGIFSLVTLSAIKDSFAPKITSQGELDCLVAKEAPKAGVTGPIEARLCDHDEGQNYTRWGRINVIEVGGNYANVNTVKHELRHAAKSHHKQSLKIKSPFMTFVNRWLRQEPQALAYEVLGLKI